MSITRKELVSKYKIATKKVEDLESKKYEYKTNVDCEPFGRVSRMSITDVVKAGATIHNGDANIADRIEQYGVLPEDLENGDGRKYMGYSIEDWDSDFKLRVDEIHNTAKIKNYKIAIEKIMNNFSEDDRFLIEMGEIDDLDLDLDDDAAANGGAEIDV